MQRALVGASKPEDFCDGRGPIISSAGVTRSSPLLSPEDVLGSNRRMCLLPSARKRKLELRRAIW